MWQGIDSVGVGIILPIPLDSLVFPFNRENEPQSQSLQETISGKDFIKYFIHGIIIIFYLR